MKIQLSKKNRSLKSAQTLVLFATHSPAADKKAKAKLTLPGASKEALEIVHDALKDEQFSGKSTETIMFRNSHLSDHKHMLVVGLGEKKEQSCEALRSAGATVWHFLQGQKIPSATLDLESLLKNVKVSAEGLQAVVEGLRLAAYDYDATKTGENKHKNYVEDVMLLSPTKGSSAGFEKALKSAEIMSECVNFSRTLADAPANKMTPQILAEETVKAAKGTGLKVTVWDKARIKKEKMGGLYGVSLGSSADPRFIIMEYKGAAASKKPVCFVGKGLTFDCGGISIKPSAGMDEMKYDMCGGANVIGTMLAIAKLKLKINVVGYVPSSENMPGPLANKPGDVLTARNGKTVEVLNTDAEGRLILMDALSYACEQKPKAIFDAATLTGAIVMALGNSYTGSFTRDKKLQKSILACSERTGEMVWPMPIHDHHVSDMKGRHADLSNISSFRGAGSSTAAAFLEQFVDKDIPWAHFDIAGTAWATSNRLNYSPKKGASGVMVRTFVELAQKIF